MPVLPVVWIFGASGVGKSTAGYRVLLDLGDAGVEAALVDADQLRLARNLAVSETELISSGLASLEREFRATGAQILIVSGIADDATHLSALLAGLPDSRVLTVHLDVEAGTLRERILRRGSLLGETEENVEAAARLDRQWADLRIDTTGRSPEQIAAVITAKVLDVLGSSVESIDAPSAAHVVTPPEKVILISGPGGVGVSTVGYSAYAQIAATGRPAAYLDAHQLGFLGRDPRSDELVPLRVANVRAVAAILTRSGARTVIITGDPITIRLLDKAWNDVTRTVAWLDASPEALAERITERARGNGPGIPGDHRAGLTGASLKSSINQAITENIRRKEMPDGTVTIDTTRMSASQVAATIATQGAIQQHSPLAVRHARPG